MVGTDTGAGKTGRMGGRFPRMWGIVLLVMIILVSVTVFRFVGAHFQTVREKLIAWKAQTKEAEIVSAAEVSDMDMIEEIEESSPEPETDSPLYTAEPVTVSKRGQADRTAGDDSLDPAKEAEDIHKVYLTFDDGPSSNTGRILDILAEYDVKATFFVVGKEEEEYQALYNRIVEEGHTLGMHSYSHKYGEIYQ
ncbi:MAG: polysaccharide deacetylase family protein, partial [Muribaculaceae bacterium]|nr:polysaccharide deacetylase family protein [Muribaculaceae bacterium]